MPKYGLQAAAHLALIQGIYSIAMTMKEPGTSGQLETSPWFNHLGILATLGGAATKKFTTLGNNPLDVGVPIGNEAGLPMTGPLSPGRPAPTPRATPRGSAATAAKPSDSAPSSTSASSTRRHS